MPSQSGGINSVPTLDWVNAIQLVGGSSMLLGNFPDFYAPSSGIMVGAIHVSQSGAESFFSINNIPVGAYHSGGNTCTQVGFQYILNKGDSFKYHGITSAGNYVSYVSFIPYK